MAVAVDGLNSNIVVAPRLWVMINLCKKYCFQLSHTIKNIHRRKLYQLGHLGKTFLQLLLLKVCETLLLGQNNKACSILWPGSVYFAFIEKRRPKTFSICRYLVWCALTLILKNSSLKCWLCFRLFLWRTQK